MKGYTYLLKNGYGDYKIGFTTQPVNKRIKELNNSTSLARKIEISAYAFNEDCTYIEKKLHEMYAHKRLKGEWFDLNVYEVRAIHSILYNLALLNDYYTPFSLPRSQPSSMHKVKR